MTRQFVLSALVVGALALSPAARAASVITTTDFESVKLPADGVIYNAGAAGGFAINGNFFNNSYEYFSDYDYELWTGWALSDWTDKKNGGLANQYSAITGGGAGGSSQYAIGYDSGDFGRAYIDLAEGQSAHFMDVTNTAYTYYSIQDGDSFTRKFQSGDFYTLTITGYDGLGGVGVGGVANSVVGSVEVVLADYRNGQSFILDAWKTVDLAALGNARSLGFSFQGGVENQYGPATPTYFALDNFQTIDAAAVPEPAGLVLLGVGLIGALGLARRGK